MRKLFTLLCWLLTWPAQAQVEESVTISDELDFPVKRYPAFADDAPILLWLPTSRGLSSQLALTATALGDLDIESWTVDLHTGYFIDTGRRSVDQFRPADLVRLIEIAAQQTSRKVYISATDTTAKPALEAIALYQRQAEASDRPNAIGGLILFHPGLHYPTQRAGEAARYVPIASNSTIPIYYFQPTISTRQWRNSEIQEVLQRGGSPVFFHPLPGVVAGFHMRPDDDLSEADIAAREQLPEDISRAIRLLAAQEPAAPPEPVTEAPPPAENRLRYGLKPLNKLPAPVLEPVDMQGNTVQVSYSEHPLSLVSFWASWCEPCIRELPSLKRLHDDYRDRGLRVITINVAEPLEDIQKIIEEFGMQAYTNLRDLEGRATRSWNVYGYPTNFLVTSDAVLSHGSIGGVEWDEAEVRTLIESLL